MRIVAKPGGIAAATLGIALAAAGLLASAPAIAAGRPPAGHPVSNHGAAVAWPGPGARWQQAVSPGGLAGHTALAWPQNVPRPGSSSELEGIYCNTAKDCWAVGEYSQHDAGLNQILRWNGKRWSQVSAPQPGGTKNNDFSELIGVRCLSAKSCWAVGEYEKSEAQLAEALHWNGKRWYAVAVPSPAGTLGGDFNELFDVFCSSEKN